MTRVVVVVVALLLFVTLGVLLARAWSGRLSSGRGSARARPSGADVLVGPGMLPADDRPSDAGPPGRPGLVPDERPWPSGLPVRRGAASRAGTGTGGRGHGGDGRREVPP